MKKIIFLILFFIIYTLLIKLCPVITLWDKGFIMNVQTMLKDLPLIIPLLPDFKLYSVMIFLPLVVGSVFYFKNKNYLNIIFLCSIPLITFLLNCILKPTIQRIRPPYEMQIAIHPDSFSYVSSHSLVTCCVWGIVIYFINKNVQNVKLKYGLIAFCIGWILFVGFSRVWLGVHYPSDVIGAYILALILLSIYNLKRWV